MKRTMLMAAVALLLSAGLSAQNSNQTRTEQQNRSRETIQNQTGGQSKNYGQMTSEQKQLRNEERKALKKQEKEMKKQQKQMRKQEAARNRTQNMNQEKTGAKNMGTRNAGPMKNAPKGARGGGPGRR